jgi:hypothetical protein
MQRRSEHTRVVVLWPNEATQQQTYCLEKMRVVLDNDVDNEPMMEILV